jgi:hypothetical protein
LILIRPEDVTDDLLAVSCIDLVEINSAIDQVAWMLAERSSQGHSAGWVFGVGLHATEKRGDRLTGCLFGCGLIHSQLCGELVHRYVSEDVVYSTHP